MRPNSLFGTSVPVDLVVDWINNFEFDFFVTLAFNDGSTPKVDSRYLSSAAQIDRLRAWDARISRLLVGKSWARSRLDRPWFFAVLEKPKTHPHWHLLFKFDPATWAAKRETQHRLFLGQAAHIWRELVPSGSTAIRSIAGQRRVVEYIAKTWNCSVSWSDVIVPDQL